MGKILIVDDHSLIRLAVRTLLERNGHDVVAEACNGIDALRLVKERRPDLIVLDITLPILDGMEFISRLRAITISARVLVFTSHNPVHFAFRCKMAGAAGFVWKKSGLTELTDAVKTVLLGYRHFPSLAVQYSHLSSAQLTEAEQLASLSNRQMLVLQCLAQGMLNREIAERMLISDKTVSTYKTRLQFKLNVSSLLDLIEFAKRNGVGNDT